jgi:hypothetical protein
VGNGIDTQPLLSVRLVHAAHYGRLRFNDLVISPQGVALAYIVVTVRSAGEYVDRPLLGAVSFAPAGPFGNLCPLILSDHTLELHQQLIFECGTGSVGVG